MKREVILAGVLAGVGVQASAQDFLEQSCQKTSNGVSAIETCYTPVTECRGNFTFFVPSVKDEVVQRIPASSEFAATVTTNLGGRGWTVQPGTSAIVSNDGSFWFLNSRGVYDQDATSVKFTVLMGGIEYSATFDGAELRASQGLAAASCAAFLGG